MKHIRFNPRGAFAVSLFIVLVLMSGCGTSKHVTIAPRHGESFVIVFQPSHQSDTGKDFNEAVVCNGIAEAAMVASPGKGNIHKVWSYDEPGLHHAREGSNTKIDHTTVVDSLGRMSGYAYELTESNKLQPDVFVAIHNNGATNRHACWGFVHEGDSHEEQNRALAKDLVERICAETNLENRGVLGDSSPNRNDYRCKNTGKLSFYSLDENVNTAPFRVLLEIGDNKASYDFLNNPQNQKKLGTAIRKVIDEWFGDTR